MSKVGKYFFITFLCLLILCLVGVLYIFIFRGKDLFGICYINLKKDEVSKSYDSAGISTIVLDSEKYAVQVSSTSDDQIYVDVKARSFGFSNINSDDLKITSVNESGVLKFKIDEPNGLLFDNSSLIQLMIPSSMEIDLILNNDKAKTKIDLADTSVKTLNYNTKSGDCEFKSGKLTTGLNLKLGSATFNLEESVETDKPNVELNLSKGRFKAVNQDLGVVNVIKNKKGHINIGSCAIINCEMKDAGGTINVKEVNIANIKSSDTNLVFGTVKAGADIRLTESGYVKIDKINSKSIISTNDGKITIKNSYAPLDLDSKDGNIKVTNAHFKVDAKTSYGDINVTFNEEFDSGMGGKEDRVLVATTKNGKVTADNVYNANVAISSKGRVDLTFNEVLGENNIVGANGEVNVKVSKDSVYTLKTSSEKGKVDVNLAQLPVGGYQERTEKVTHVNTSSESSNKITISTKSGQLKLSDY
ncbi:MAG: DUF4097 domain-containing protein [Clostridiales bacterium]|nr:DUF4097 domain-containing protein [Clostridiales bacterium]